MMTRSIKYLSYSLAMVLTIIFLIIVGIVFFINPNDYKDEISQQVFKATGRQLTLAGDLKWSFYPSLGLEVNQATLSNADTFTEMPFATIDHAKISIQLLPLFLGKIETGHLSLDNVQLNLTRNAKGVTNWQDLIALNAKNGDFPKDTISTTSAEKTKSSHHLALMMTEIQIQNAKIHWEDLLKKENKTYIIHTFDSRNINTHAYPFQVKASMAFQQDLKNPPVDVDFMMDVQCDLSNQHLRFSGIDFNFNNLKLTGNLEINKAFSPDFSYQGKFHLPSFDVAAFIETMTHQKFKNAELIGLGTGDFNISGTANSLEIADAVLNVGDTNIHFSTNMSDIHALIGNFILSMSHVNIDNYAMIPQVLPANMTQPPKKPTQKKSAQNQPIVKKQSTLNRFAQSNLQGQISIDNLVVNKVALTQLSTSLVFHRGILELKSLKSNVSGGSLNFDIIDDLTQKIPHYSLMGNVLGLQINPLLSALTNKESGVSGALNMNIVLKAMGKTQTSLLKSLSGTADVKLDNGQLPGLNVLDALNHAASIYFRSQTVTPTASPLHFASITSHFSITQGIAYTSNATLSSASLKANASGSINLVNQALNLSLLATVVGTSFPQVEQLQMQIGGGIPLIVQGSLSHPKVYADMQVITREALKHKIGRNWDRLGKDLNKTGRDLKEQLKSLF
jgi:AsmA protein